MLIFSAGLSLIQSIPFCKAICQYCFSKVCSAMLKEKTPSGFGKVSADVGDA